MVLQRQYDSMGAAGSPLGKILETDKIEYCRMNIEYLRYSSNFKKAGAERHPQL